MRLQVIGDRCQPLWKIALGARLQRRNDFDKLDMTFVNWAIAQEQGVAPYKLRRKGRFRHLLRYQQQGKSGQEKKQQTRQALIEAALTLMHEGAGFSGLSHLRRVPVDGVKIDRSFVADVLRDPDDLALTSAIIAMAHSLGITVVAEGIEAEGQYEVLRERGCDQGQGFWLGRPMPAAEIQRRFRE